MAKYKKQHPKREKVALEALKQGMAVVKRGLEIHGLYADGSTEVISRSTAKEYVWSDALQALQERKKAIDVKNTSDVLDTTKLKIYTDGGSRGNPGPSASGYVVMTENDQILKEGGQYLGIATNNQAEYQAVKLALEEASEFKPEKIDFYIDSLLVVNQLKGQYKVKSRDLWPVYEAIKDLASTHKSVEFHHVYREFNSLADEQVNIILDKQAELQNS